jgi:hypothetical protein
MCNRLCKRHFMIVVSEHLMGASFAMLSATDWPNRLFLLPAAQIEDTPRPRLEADGVQVRLQEIGFPTEIAHAAVGVRPKNGSPQ